MYNIYIYIYICIYIYIYICFPRKVPNLFDIIASFMYTSLPPPFLLPSLMRGITFYPFICNFTLQ